MSRLTVTALSGGADAFVQAEMATALTGIKGTAFKVLELSYEFVLPAVSVFPQGAAASQDVQISLTRRTKTAVPNLGDVDLIHKWAWSAAYYTAANVNPPFPKVGRYQPPGEILIVEDPLYLQLDSTATTATWSVVVNLEYEVVKISDIDRLSLLTLSLG
jgi:hypothetical protein